MATVECGGIHYCPELEGPFSVQPQQAGPAADQLQPGGLPPPLALGLLVAPPAGQWVVYLLTLARFQLVNSGSVVGEATIDAGWLAFDDTAGDPLARLNAQGAGTGTLSVDATGAVFYQTDDPSPNARQIRIFAQLSAPQSLAVPPLPPPIP